MRNRRALTLLATTLAVLLFSNIFNTQVSTNRFNESYPAAVCPPNLQDLSTAISLSSPKTMVRKTGTSSMQTAPVGFRRYAVAAQSAVIEAGAVTPVVWQVRKGVWAGAVPCSAPISSQWFVGATADITSKGSLNIVNSGLGRALVEVTVYTDNGVNTPRAISLRPNSYISLSLPSLAPGSKQIAIHLLPRSGRVNGFVVDERGKGLQALGGDIVNSTGDPTKLLRIPAIPQQTGRRGSTPQTLRLLVPGDVDARISAEIKSTVLNSDWFYRRMLPGIGKPLFQTLQIVINRLYLILNSLFEFFTGRSKKFANSSYFKVTTPSFAATVLIAILFVMLVLAVI